MLHAARVTRQVHRRLSGGVAAADDVDVLAGELARLRRGRAVEDARARQLVDAGHVQPPVLDAGGEDHRPRGRLFLVAQLDDVPPVLEAHPGHPSHQEEPGAEHPRLLVGALRQLGAAHSAREPEVVADQ